MYDADKAFVGGAGPLTDGWCIAEFDEAKIGPAVRVDPSITLDADQVVRLGRGSSGLDGEG